MVQLVQDIEVRYSKWDILGTRYWRYLKWDILSKILVVQRVSLCIRVRDCFLCLWFVLLCFRSPLSIPSRPLLSAFEFWSKTRPLSRNTFGWISLLTCCTLCWIWTVTFGFGHWDLGLSILDREYGNKERSGILFSLIKISGMISSESFLSRSSRVSCIFLYWLYWRFCRAAFGGLGFAPALLLPPCPRFKFFRRPSGSVFTLFRWSPPSLVF